MNNIISFDVPMDYTVMTSWIEKMKLKYPFLEIDSIGRSFMGKEIWCIVLGKGAKNTLYCGAHHAQEWVTSQLLMRFIEDFCENKSMGTPFKGYKANQFFDNNKLYIIPMLNPDGVDLGLYGLKENHPLYERLIRQNEGRKKFSTWQANIRGVDLNHNYNAGWGEAKMKEREYGIFGGGPTRYGGEYPESEPETQAICRLVRSIKFEMVIAFHSQGEEIFYDFNGYTPKGALSKAQIMSKVTGYVLSHPEDMANGAGFKDWFIDKFDLPGYTIEVGKGKNPLPLSDFEKIYNKIAELFIVSPKL